MTDKYSLEDMLVKAWNEAYRVHYGIDYAQVDIQAETQALWYLNQQAEKRGWSFHQAVAFFKVAIEVLERDAFWKENVCLVGASKRINTVYQYARKKKAEEKKAGDFRPDMFREEAKEEKEKSNPEAAAEAMKRIKELTGRVAKTCDSPSTGSPPQKPTDEEQS